MKHVKTMLTRVGGGVRWLGEGASNAFRVIWAWLCSPRVKAVLGRLFAAVLLMVFSPQLVALWRIALYGEAYEQGLLCWAIILLGALWSIRRRLKQLPKPVKQKPATGPERSRAITGGRRKTGPTPKQRKH